MAKRLPIVLVAAGTIVAILGTAAFGQPNERSTSPTAQQAAAGPLAAAQRGPRGRRGPRGFRGFRGLRGLPGATGPTGATGAAGAPGPAGATGQTGATGAPGGLSGHQFVQADSAAVQTSGFQNATATASCPAGKKVVGGGFELIEVVGGFLQEGPDVLVNKPVTTDPQGWTATLRANSNEDWFARVHAICANPA